MSTPASRHAQAQRLAPYKELAADVTCVLCGSTERLAYHHEEGSTKLFPIVSSIALGYQINDVILEIRKCVVLCSGCHHRAIHNSFPSHAKAHSIWDDGRFWDKYQHVFDEWLATNKEKP